MCFKGLNYNRKSVKVDGVSAEIGNWNPPNISQIIYGLNCLGLWSFYLSSSACKSHIRIFYQYARYISTQALSSSSTLCKIYAPRRKDSRKIVENMKMRDNV